MDNDIPQEKLKFFVKTGIVVLSVLVLVVLGIRYIPSAISVTNSASSKKLPIYSVNKEDNKISLSFDVVFGNQDTAEILEILALHNVKAAFFMTGDWIEKYPDEVKAIAAAGHDLGNHSENHKHMSQLSKEESIKEIVTAHNKVKELTGIEMNLFRAPYGDYNNALIDVTEELGYYPISWNVDSLDWKDYGANSIIKTVVENKNLGKGSIILCHSGAKYTKDALEAMITGLKEKGYQFVPISSLIYTGDYYMDKEGRQFEK